MGRPARRGKKHDMGGTVVDQAGALCLRVSPGGEPQILLVGSRRNGRWGLPKGHVEPGETSHEAAARVAFEEAGIRGKYPTRSWDRSSIRKTAARTATG